MNRKMFPGVVLVTGMTLLGVLMALLAVSGARGVPDDTAAFYRGGAPGKCYTTPNINCSKAGLTCPTTTCTDGGVQFNCPAGSVDHLQTNNQYKTCSVYQPTGFATCSTSKENNGGTIVCISQRACDFSTVPQCAWNQNQQNWFCRSDPTNPTNGIPAYTFYIPATGGTCP